MNLQELEKKIIESLANFKFDQDEKLQFRELSEELRPDQLSFIRNKSFELSRPHVEKGGADAVRVLNWLGNIVQTIQPVAKKTIVTSEAYFSPGDDCRNKIVNLIGRAKETVNICVFTISDNRITKAIVDAHQRGVTVTVISDNDKANDKGSDIHFLIDKGLDVTLDNSPFHMHHKFAIFDNKILLNGSFNWTRSASSVNEENILITADPDLVYRYTKQFLNLKKDLSAE